jgi:N-acetylglucosaminyldiphosphoundecaprenol N-acetyl-beta-D-mannosaminyltransferase
VLSRISAQTEEYLDSSSSSLSPRATFDFFSGRIQQAPEWVRNAGFEWLYRLLNDFRRLWVRYTVYNFIFIVMFGLQLMGSRRFEAAK